MIDTSKLTIESPFDSGDYPASVLVQGDDIALTQCDTCGRACEDWPDLGQHSAGGKPGAMYQAALYCADCAPASYDDAGQRVDTLTGAPVDMPLAEGLNRRRALDLVRDSYDPHDPWGSCMTEFFGIASVLYFRTDRDVPDSWAYSPGAARDVDTACYPDSEYARQLALGYMTADDLLYAGAVLDRLSDRIKASGRDY